jgi:hypothetical protein
MGTWEMQSCAVAAWESAGPALQVSFSYFEVFEVWWEGHSGRAACVGGLLGGGAYADAG